MHRPRVPLGGKVRPSSTLCTSTSKETLSAASTRVVIEPRCHVRYAGSPGSTSPETTIRHLGWFY